MVVIRVLGVERDPMVYGDRGWKPLPGRKERGKNRKKIRKKKRLNYCGYQRENGRSFGKEDGEP